MFLQQLNEQINAFSNKYLGIIAISSLLFSLVSVYFCFNIFSIEKERIKAIQFLQNDIEPSSKNILDKIAIIEISNDIKQIKENSNYIKSDITVVLTKIKSFINFMDRYEDVRVKNR